VSKVHQLVGRIGGLTKAARTTDKSAATAPARRAFLLKFESEPDPEAARKLYFARLSLKRWQSRQRKRRAA
jgi:hypothetical protein